MAKSITYYQILGLEDLQDHTKIDVDRLRHAYKQALLYYHPDKQHAGPNKHQGGSVPSIDQISQAYKVLADPQSRSQYDQRLRLQRADGENTTRHTGMETVDLDELNFDEDAGRWAKPCRCSSEFVVTESELEKNADYGELITGCKGCSLWLKVLFTVEG